jgi:hypothetical protein
MMAAQTAAPFKVRKGFAGFAVAMVALTAVSAWAMTLAFSGPRDGAAILTSAVLALAIQLGTFSMLRRLAASNLIGAMGAGMAVRFGSLILYALLAPGVLLLPVAPALLSLALFYFLSMVIEPVFFRI